MSRESFTVTSVVVDLDGGRQLRVARYVDPGTDHPVIHLEPTWPDDPVGIPSGGGSRGSIRLPAACAGHLIEALHSLQEAGD